MSLPIRTPAPDAGCAGRSIDRPLAVLVTNIALADRAGSDLYTRDLVRGLQASGHRPVVYTPRPGAVAQEMAEMGIAVVDDLRQLAVQPDVIHGNHTAETTEAVFRLPGVPVVFVCHGLGWMAEPPRLGAVQRYVAVGAVTLERLVTELRLPPDRCRLILNGVDTARFRPRQRPLPERPQRALLFSNGAAPGGFLDVVRQACELRGIDLDVAGRGVGRTLDRPEDVLANYDLVFGRGRCAREAMASGCAVVLVDLEGVGGFMSPDRVRRNHGASFGASMLTDPHDPSIVGHEIDRYDPVAAAEAAAILRREGSLDCMIRQLVETYREAILDHAGAATDPVADFDWLLDYLPRLSGLGLERDEVLLDRHLLHGHTTALQRRLDRTEAALAWSGDQLAGVSDELHDLRSTRTFQTREQLLRSGPIRRILQVISRAIPRR